MGDPFSHVFVDHASFSVGQTEPHDGLWKVFDIGMPMSWLSANL